jgi:A-kinase anchor protein 1
MISAVVAPNHVFLQQITHPTYPSLARLDHCMAQCYNEFVTPELPRPVQANMICAAPSMDGWFRAKIVAVYPPSSVVSVGDFETVANDAVSTQVHQTAVTGDIIAVEEEDYEVDICFVDYGGYSRVMASSLRQIRADFMSLPFQAIECLLANVGPVNGMLLIRNVFHTVSL